MVSVPKLAFIVPYRNRPEQLEIYLKQMSVVLDDISQSDYMILICHQNDERPFNRGAMKNIGFHYIKTTFPNDYKNITLIFNDVDIVCLKKNQINFDTVAGIVKHHYGFEHTLGGLLSINAFDFEKCIGFPNMWSWGFEDTLLQNRVYKVGTIEIDRTRFFNLMSKIHEPNQFLNQEVEATRIVNKNEYIITRDNRFELYYDGINTLKNVTYNYDDVSKMLTIDNFDTRYPAFTENNKEYNVNKGNNLKAVLGVGKRNSRMKMVFM